VIDGQNRRIGKKVCAAPCDPEETAVLQQGFLYADQLRIVAELDGNNDVVSRFVYGTRSNVPDFLVKGGVTYRILSDQVGSVRLVVNASTGVVAQRIDYEAFGVVTTDTAPGFQPFGFAGGLADRDTGLVRFGARDYDPRVGRWATKDPIRFDGGMNQHEYAESDPVNLVDPTGLDPERAPANEFANQLEDDARKIRSETPRSDDPLGIARRQRCRVLGIDCRSQDSAGADPGFCEPGSPLDEFCDALEGLCISNNPIPPAASPSSHPEGPIMENLGRRSTTDISRERGKKVQ